MVDLVVKTRTGNSQNTGDLQRRCVQTSNHKRLDGAAQRGKQGRGKLREKETKMSIVPRSREKSGRNEHGKEDR